MEHKGRKPIYDDPLVIVSLSLRRDQRAYLRKLPNASEWIRGLIDSAIAQETGNAELDIIGMSKRISVLEREIRALTESSEYKNSRVAEEDYEWLKYFREKLSNDATYIVSYYKDSALLIIGARRWGFNNSAESIIQGWTRQELEDFLSGKGVDEGEINAEIAIIIIDRILNAMVHVHLIKAAYDAKVTEYKEKIQRLQDKIRKYAGK